ncbi:MAG: hypothetical protein N4A72_15820 [Bacteroidales bacterium]|jgi:F0F1-type ATP synthase assembly protein I|nr:hypothetical protein [Bacteroidales bacterium]
MENNLWTMLEDSNYYVQNKELYQNHIIEQYKLYVEMSDRISARRNLANVFFLTLNSMAITVIGFIVDKAVQLTPSWFICFPLLGVIILCIVWWWLLRSYRNLNSAKYYVIGLLEKKLPSSPYWSAEWKRLGEGKVIKKYLPLTVIECYVPFIFLFLYLIIVLYFLAYK